MKKIVLILTALLLTGCFSAQRELERAMELRGRLLRAKECSFDAHITADYGQEVYTFSLKCKSDAQGNIQFELVEPETIAGITGKIEGKSGMLTFDHVALEVGRLTQRRLSPVSAPQILMKTLLSGYITAAGEEGDELILRIDDRYEEDALHLDVRLNGQNLPISADVLDEGSRILQIRVENFTIA